MKNGMGSKAQDVVRYRRSPFVHLFSDGNSVVLFHALNKKLFVINRNSRLCERFLEDKEFSGLSEDERSLLKKNFLVEKGYDPNVAIYAIKQQYFKSIPDISTLYLHVQMSCNYSCSYCIVKESMDSAVANIEAQMTRKTAREALNKFEEVASASGAKKRSIVFYGGEPLLNFKLIQYVIEYAKNLGMDYKFSIISNGSLVTDRVARYLKEQNVHVAISIDGTKNSHNTKRVDHSGNGTYEATIDGVNHLKVNGIIPSVSNTLHSDNVGCLEESLRHLSEEIGVNRIGINIAHGVNAEEFDFAKATSVLLDIFDRQGLFGLQEQRLKTKIDAFINNKPILKHCSAYGNKMVVTPDGAIGPCHSFINTKYFSMNVKNSSRDIINSEAFKSFSSRSILHNDTCMKCPAITMCGGGCAYTSYCETATLTGPDTANCKYTLTVLEWLISKAYALEIGDSSVPLKKVSFHPQKGEFQ